MSGQNVDAAGNPMPQMPVLLADDKGNAVGLTCQNGDLVAIAISGPNAGKSTNLTYGKWA